MWQNYASSISDMVLYSVSELHGRLDVVNVVAAVFIQTGN